MNRFFTTIFLLFSFQCVFAQDCNLAFGYTRTGSGQRFLVNSTMNSCKGDSIVIIADSLTGVEYKWYLNDNEIFNSKKKSLVIKDKPGKYSVKIIKGDCSASRSITISYFDYLFPTINGKSTSKDVTICDKNDNFYIRVEPNLTGNTKYQWQRNGLDIEGANEFYYIAKEIGTYSARVSIGSCHASSPPVNLKLSNQILANLLINNEDYPYDTLKMCKDIPIRIALNNETYSDLSILKNNKNISNQRIFNITDSGIYNIEAKSGDCLIKTKPLTVIVGETMEPFNIIQTSKGLDFNDVCHYNILFPSLTTFYNIINPGFEFINEWKRNGITQIKEKGHSILLIDKIGTYNLQISYGSCKIESKKLEITNITPKIVKLYPFSEEKKIEICKGRGISLPNIPNSKEGFQGGLYKDGKLIPLNSENSDVTDRYYISESGKYYTIFSRNSCIIYSDTVEFIIKGNNTAQILIENKCQNNAYELSIPWENGFQYSWKKNGKIIPNYKNSRITVEETGIYSAVLNQDYCSYETPQVLIGSRILAKPEYCLGQTIQLNSRKNNIYEWKGPNGFVSNLQNPSIPKISSSSQGVYILKVIDENKCTFSDSIFIKINPSPEFSIQVPNIICEGQSFSIKTKMDDNSNVFFNILTPDGLNFNFTNNWEWTRNNSNQKMGGIYKVTATYSNGKCPIISTTQITINSPTDCPSITIGDLSKMKFCNDGEFDIPFETTGTFKPNTIFTVNYINYDGNYVPINSGTKSPIKIRIPGNYRLIITVNDSDVSSQFSNFLNPVYVRPSNIIYNSTSACTGFSITLKLDTSNLFNKFEQIQWKLDDKIIEGATSLEYIAKKTGVYRVQAFQSGCSVETSEGSKVKITIGELEKPIVVYNSESIVCEGYSVDLGSYHYSSDVNLQWNFDGKPLDGMNSSTLIARKKGNYSLTIKQSTCEATSDVMFVNIGDILQNSIVGFDYNSGNYRPDKVDLCKGTPYELFFQPFFDFDRLVVSADSVARKLGYELQWQKNGIDIPNANRVSYKIENDGDYRLKIRQGSCVAFSKTSKIKYSNEIKLNYGWNRGNSIINNSNNVFLCENDSIKVYLYGNTSLNFKNPTSVYESNTKLKELKVDNSSFYVSKTGKYWVSQSYQIKGSNEVCTATTDTLNIKIGGKRIEIDVPNISTCLDTLSMNTDYINNATYKWIFNEAFLPKDTSQYITVFKAGTYQWEINTPTCQFASKPFTLTLGKLEAEIESSINSEICYGNPYLLNYNVKSVMWYYDNAENKYKNPPINYQWKKDGLPIILNPYFPIYEDGIYSLTINQGKCSVTTNPVTVKFNKIPRSISPSDSTFICPNGGFMELNGTTDPSYTYNWFKDNKLLSNQTKSNLKVSETGIYTAQIESGECATLTYPVKVYQNTIRPSAFISSFKENSSSDSTQIKIDLTSSAPWTVKLTDKQIFTVNKTPYLFSVKPLQDTSYELASVENTCGEGTVSGKAEVKVLVLGNEEIIGSKINLFPVPTQANCQLTIDLASPEKLDWKLLNSEGRILSKAENHNVSVYHNQNIDLKSFPVGTYILKITIGKQTVSRKIIKLD